MLEVAHIDHSDVNFNHSDTAAYLLKRYSKVVKHLAFNYTHTNSPLTMDDLYQEGLIALFECAKAYKGDRPEFYSYMTQKVRGRMLDTLRNYDTVSRSLRLKQKKITKAKALLEREGVVATNKEIAETIGISINEYYDILLNLSINFTDVNTPIMEDSLECTTQLDPSEIYEHNEQSARFVEIVSRFSQRDKAILEMYYLNGIVLADIGLIFGLTESRVSQIASKLLIRIKTELK